MLPTKYKWLEKELSPKILVEGLKEYGTTEIKGSHHNQKILNWAKELGISAVYSSDEIPWCGLFVGVVVLRTGRVPIAKMLWARSWAKWGEQSDSAELGDILVFSRGSGGHVGIYVGEDDECFHVLGGNQSDKVCITRIAIERCIAVRRPKYINKPVNVRKVTLAPTGEISVDEG